MKHVHLVCNAHLDPVWLWNWEEGAAAALSTFRSAADLCEQYEGFIFNHNEVILYEWIEQYEPELFERIRKLIDEGRWHVMGGWYLQPDCNLPCGESFVRQILAGRRYFHEKLGVRPTVALNFDPFGHTRGLVQIMARSGFEGYLFCRPDLSLIEMPGEDFVWVGFDGSEILGHHATEHYNSPMGTARAKVEKKLEDHPDKDLLMVLWGIGNHGGGPSRLDIEQLGKLIEEFNAPGKREMIHSTPEAFFGELKGRRGNLPKIETDINPFATGCYTSLIRIKQKHRRLENMLWTVEKMCVHAMLAASQGGRLFSWPAAELAAAERDLMTSQFHDILPGSGIQPVEEDALRMLDHGLEILSRVRAHAFFALSGGQAPAGQDEYPILVYNPHPFAVRTIVECEFQPPDLNFTEAFDYPGLKLGDQSVPCQGEKELSNLFIDWRKRIAFEAELAPGQVTRFDATLTRLEKRPPAAEPITGSEPYVFQNESMEVAINPETGLIDRYEVGGVNYLEAAAAAPILYEDDQDAWGMFTRTYRNPCGRFTPVSLGRAAELAGFPKKKQAPAELAPVRIIEQGSVRVVVEAILECDDSRMIVTYKLPRRGTEIEIDLRVYWNERNRMLKLAFPLALPEARLAGQTAFGDQPLRPAGEESVAQQWLLAECEDRFAAFSVINDGTYGCDYNEEKRTLQLSLLRSAAYAGNPVAEHTLVPFDRVLPRMDQGERRFRFWLNAGPARERREAIDREALLRNQPPFALSFSPSGQGQAPPPLAGLNDAAIQLIAFKQAADGEGYIVRLFNPMNERRKTSLEIPALGIEQQLELGPYEVATYRVGQEKQLKPVNLIEEPLAAK